MQRASKAFLTLTLFAVVALSGCFGGDDDGEGTNTSTSSPTGSGTDTGSQSNTDTGTSSTQTQTGGDETPIVAALLADADAGQVPLAVNFTVDGEPAEAATTWTLDFGDGADAATGTGDEFPMQIEHSYDAEGNYSATLTVTAGDGRSKTATHEITVSAAGPPPDDGPKDIIVNLDGEMPAFFPAGLLQGAPANGGPGDPGNFCWALQTGHDEGNGTFAEVYSFEVAEGATKVYIEGGTDPLDPLGATPDFDVVIQAADGTCVVGGSAGSYETAELASPAAGTTLVGILYWFGPPAQAYTGLIEVRY